MKAIIGHSNTPAIIQAFAFLGPYWHKFGTRSFQQTIGIMVTDQFSIWYQVTFVIDK
jgi:hypothetical protein